jgi:hypothetical protein
MDAIIDIVYGVGDINNSIYINYWSTFEIIVFTVIYKESRIKDLQFCFLIVSPIQRNSRDRIENRVGDGLACETDNKWCNNF